MIELELEQLATNLVDGLASFTLSTGRFDKVNQHEPKSAPGSGLTAAIWADYIGPSPQGAGLDVTDGLLVLKERLYMPLGSEPEDGIDPAMMSACMVLMAAYSARFSLGIVDTDGDAAAWIDLRGISRNRLEAAAGYLKYDERQYRVMTMTVPVIVDDLWPQGQ
jgi:hypothetical protein